MVNIKSVLLFLAVSIMTACGSFDENPNNLTDVYVADFQSDDMTLCKPSDVDLTHAQASEFFGRAKIVTSKELHDHYNYAPCYIEGTLKKGSQACEFHIRAGATGQIQCGSTVEYFACDDCQALFE